MSNRRGWDLPGHWLCLQSACHYCHLWQGLGTTAGAHSQTKFPRRAMMSVASRIEMNRCASGGWTERPNDVAHAASTCRQALVTARVCSSKFGCGCPLRRAFKLEARVLGLLLLSCLTHADTPQMQLCCCASAACMATSAACSRALADSSA
jgi:hypothetical protein